MSEENKVTQNCDKSLERLKILAETQGITVDEFLLELEEKQTAINENLAKENKSTGPLSGNQSGFFDPIGTEFLKGIRNK